MGHSAKAEAVLALHRFGMGPRPGSIAAIESDPRGALLAELDRPRAGEVAARIVAVERAGLPHGRRRQRRAAGPADRWRRARKRRRRAAAGPSMAEGAEQAGMRDGGQDGRRSGSRPRAADLPQRGESAHRRRARRRDRLCRAAGVVLVEPFLHLGRQDPEHVRRLRARGHPSPHPGPLRRHAAGRREAIRRCCSTSTTQPRWARTRSPASTAPAASTRTSRARSWSCIRWACAPAIRRTTSSASPRC